jgi:glycerol-3-phosphate dehydrogenase
MRQSTLKDLSEKTFDVAIVGGGINGAVAAAALQAGGLQVALLEKSDFASSTSQESSNLVWGGIKYLESYEFGLVWGLCRSRNELMRKYPSSVKEIRFFTTLQKGFRKPRLLVFLGAVLYWAMGRFFTRPPRLLTRGKIHDEEPLIETDGSVGGMEYSDGYLRDNDARFVFQFIRTAMRLGARALNYAEVVGAEQRSNLWTLTVEDRVRGGKVEVKAKVLINAAGPYADSFNRIVGLTTRHKHVFSKGVHLIVPRLSENKRVLTFFADDGRLFFVIPMGACSCIGTTDTPVERLPAQVNDDDRRFILENINKRLRLKRPLTMADVLSERCGVRPLVKEASAKPTTKSEDWMNLSRKHAIETQRDLNHITIFGGKLTDCLNIGRELCHELKSLGIAPTKNDEWFGESSHKYVFEQAARKEGLGETPGVGEGGLIDRLWRCYDQDAFAILDRMKEDPSLKQAMIEGSSVTLAEFAHMASAEMVVTLEDALRRRTRLALVVPHEQLKTSPLLKRATELLFKDQAEAQWQNYFGPQSHSSSWPRASSGS